MTKVKVNKEVAEVLLKLESYRYQRNIVLFMTHFATETITPSTFMQQHNLSDDDLINAYKYGWEVEYEFRVGDEVGYATGEWIYIDSKNVVVHEMNIEFINNHINDFILVCKAENREDLKKC
jgi:hypothetical protein